MANNEWQTPPRLLQTIAQCLGGIDLDPCSTHRTAKRILTPDDDGLATDWALKERQTVFMNPPYGRGQPIAWADKLLSELGPTNRAITLTKLDNSRATRSLNENCSAVCLPFKRVAFTAPKSQTQVRGTSFPVVLHHFGPDHGLFVTHFSLIGTCFAPHGWPRWQIPTDRGSPARG